VTRIVFSVGLIDHNSQRLLGINQKWKCSSLYIILLYYIICGDGMFGWQVKVAALKASRSIAIQRNAPTVECSRRKYELATHSVYNDHGRRMCQCMETHTLTHLDPASSA